MKNVDIARGYIKDAGIILEEAKESLENILRYITDKNRAEWFK